MNEKQKKRGQCKNSQQYKVKISIKSFVHHDSRAFYNNLKNIDLNVFNRIIFFYFRNKELWIPSSILYEFNYI